MSAALPQGFELLEPFVDRFAVSGSAARARLRSESGEGERRAFYMAAKDLIAPALDLLDQKPLADLDSAEQRLMDLTLSFAHIALAVEVHGADEGPHAAMREHMRITRSPADLPA